VTFIPKPGKANYTEAKAYRPISLSSFMLKTIEKLVDRHIRDEILGLQPLHPYQFAYQPGKTTETALQHVITCIEEAVENREVTLEALLDIEGAFDSTSHSIIIEAAKRHGLEDTICRWINFMLGKRKIIATLAGETLEGSVARGCPQGGVLLPLLWSLVWMNL
jgi:retron-type reverse transcriptase